MEMVLPGSRAGRGEQENGFTKTFSNSDKKKVTGVECEQGQHGLLHRHLFGRWDDKHELLSGSTTSN